MSTLPTPHPNSYWVDPGRLLAGEYPGSKREAEAREKLRRFLDAGIDCFVDLTHEADGMVPYDGLLRELAATLRIPVEHHRHPIRDVSVPRDRRDMVAILDRIDAALAAGRKVYVHCWGGTGRTGTVIGCYLVRRGLTGEEALARVLELWRTMAKAPLKWRAPETDEQHDYVRQWHEKPPIAGPTPEP